MTRAPLAFDISDHRLANGLRVVVNPDHTNPIVALNLWYNVGSRHEVAGRTGFAHLFEHLMFQGSANVSSGEHITRLQAVGAKVNATTWFDRTNYFETVPVGALDLALWLEADRLASLPTALSQANLNNQREVVKEEKRQRYDNVPYGDLTYHLFGNLFPAGHPYHHITIGSMADLDAATLDDVQSFFASHYVPNNAVVTLSGDITTDDALARVERCFGAIACGSPPGPPHQPSLPPLTAPTTVDVAANVPADAVYHAWRLPPMDSPAYDAIDLFLAVLGDGHSARLEGALVRDNEIAEKVGAGSLGLIGGNSVGLAFAMARREVSPGVVDRAIGDELTRLLDEGPTPRELARAKAQYERAALHGFAYLDARADEINRLATLCNDPHLINSQLDRVLGLDSDYVTACARDWLQPDSRFTLTYHQEAR